MEEMKYITIFFHSYMENMQKKKKLQALVFTGKKEIHRLVWLITLKTTVKKSSEKYFFYSKNSFYYKTYWRLI